MRLYDIDAEILNCVDQESGEVIDTDKLAALEMERDKKISDIACWIKDLNADAEAIKNEVKSLQERQHQAEKKAESLKAYLSIYLNGEKFKDSRVSISFRKSVSVELSDNLDINALPEEFKKITVEANKKAIKEKLTAGEKIEGCNLNINNNIQIK